MFRKAIHTLAVFSLLFATWCLLSGVFTPLFFGIAAGCCLLVTVITLRMEVTDNESHPFQLIYLGPMYWTWLAKEMVISGLQVSRIIWRRELNLNSDFSWVRTHFDSDLGRAIYANSLTLTPGTVCVDIVDGRVYIHALDKASLNLLELGELERRVNRISSIPSVRHQMARDAKGRAKKAAKKVRKDAKP